MVVGSRFNHLLAAFGTLLGAPFITVSPSSTPDGSNYGAFTPNTQTSGIQEAINASVTKYGGVYIVLLAGTFTCQTAIYLDANGPSNGGKIIGAGKALSIVTWGTGLSGSLFNYQQVSVATTNWYFAFFTVIGKSGAPVSTDLNGALTTNQTTITVDSAAGFPAGSTMNYMITIDSEQMMVTGGQGTLTWTVVRGVNGTAGATHADEAFVATQFPLWNWIQKEGGARHIYDDVLFQESTSAVAYTFSDLNGAITNSATSLTVDSAVGFPSSGNYFIIVESEIMLVTGGQGTTTWTVTRGIAFTAAAAHGDEALVYLLQTSNSFFSQGAEDCDVRGLQTTSNNPAIFPAAFAWSCFGGALRTDECVFYTAEVLAAQWISDGGAAQAICLDSAGVPFQADIRGLFINPNTLGPIIQVQKIKSNSQFIISLRSMNVNGAYQGVVTGTFPNGTPVVHDLTGNCKVFAELSGSDVYSNSTANGTAGFCDASQFLCALLSPTQFTNWVAPQQDIRTSVAATDGAAIVLATWVTTFSAAPSGTLKARIFGAGGTITSGVYTLTWKEGGVTITKTLTISAVDTEAHDSWPIQPDTGTTITARLTTLTGTSPTVNVSAIVTVDR